MRSRESEGIVGQVISFVRTRLGILSLPDNINKVDLVQWCWLNWQENLKLIVFDNVQHYDDIKPFLPPSDSRQFRVLLTSNKKLSTDRVKSFPIFVLSEEDALDLLRSLLKTNPNKG